MPRLNPSETPDAVQARILRGKTPMERIELAVALTRQAYALAWADLRRLHPQDSEAELQIRFRKLLWSDDVP
jgi:hypothetical protein